MKLDEVFDENYYDFIQDEMKRKVYDPHEDMPAEDTEMHMGDYIISAFEAGKLSYNDAKKRLEEIADSAIDLNFWKMELAMASELLDEPITQEPN